MGTLQKQLETASNENVRLKRETEKEIRQRLYGLFGESGTHPETYQVITSFTIIEKAIEGKILGHSYVSVFHNDYPYYEIPHALEEALNDILGVIKIDADHTINGVAIHF